MQVACAKLGQFGGTIFQYFKHSETAKKIGNHWSTPVLEDEQPGKVWRAISFQDENGVTRTYHQYIPTNDCYPADEKDWALAKTLAAGICFFGYFGANFLKEFSSGSIKTAKEVKAMLVKFNQQQHQPNFDKNTFLESEFLNFKDAAKPFYQAVKSFAVIAPFYYGLSALNLDHIFGISISTLCTISAVAYAFYDPLKVRVHLNRFEDLWRSQDVKVLTEKEVNNLTVFQTLKHLTDGSYSLSHLFKMHKITEEQVEKTQKIKKHNLETKSLHSSVPVTPEQHRALSELLSSLETSGTVKKNQ